MGDWATLHVQIFIIFKFRTLNDTWNTKTSVVHNEWIEVQSIDAARVKYRALVADFQGMNPEQVFKLKITIE